MLNDSVDRETMTELARDLVAEVAPNELPIFPSVSRSYFASGEKVSGKQRDETLGFGLDVALLTPYLLSTLSAVVSFLVNEVLKSVKGEASAAVSDVVKKLFKRGKHAPKSESDEDSPALTREQASRAHKLAVERAESLGLSKEKAKFLADAIVGSLVVT